MFKSTGPAGDNQRIPAGSQILARGTAADVWLSHTLDRHGRKYVIKIIRISLGILRENCNPRAGTCLFCIRSVYQLSKSRVQGERSKRGPILLMYERPGIVHDESLLTHLAGLPIQGRTVEGSATREYRKGIWCTGRHRSPCRILRPWDCITIDIVLSFWMITRMATSNFANTWRILDVLAGLEYLHSREPAIVHGCICMASFFLYSSLMCSFNASAQDKLLIDDQGRTKITEFGLTSLVEGFGLFAPSISQANRTRWSSPELLDPDIEDQTPAYTVASDVWALGCTLFEIISGKLPYFKFKHDLRVQQEILSEKLPGRRDSCLSPELEDFWPVLSQCWSWTPEHRPTVGSLAHSRDSCLSPELEDFWPVLSQCWSWTPEHRPTVGSLAHSTLLLNIQKSEPQPVPHLLLDQVQSPAPPAVTSFPEAPVNIFANSFPKGISEISATDALPVGYPAQSAIDSLFPISVSDKPLMSGYTGWIPPPSDIPDAVSPATTAYSTYRATRTMPSLSAEAQGVNISPRRCNNCRRFRMKCSFDSPEATVCQRCQATGTKCVFNKGSRRARADDKSLERLSAQIDEKDTIIEGLQQILAKLLLLSHSAQPDKEYGKSEEGQTYGFIQIDPTAKLLLGREGHENAPVDKGKAKAELDDRNNQTERENELEVRQSYSEFVMHPGITSEEQTNELEVRQSYSEFVMHPGITSEEQTVPKVSALGIVTDEEAEYLFRVFFQKINPSIGIFNPVIHAVNTIKIGSELLFTVICAIASRYWMERPETYTTLIKYAKMAATQVLFDGSKSIESCQAFLLLSIYQPPVRRWQDDRSGLYLSSAIRLAQDLDLDVRDSESYLGAVNAPEVLNKIRTWLLCYKLDQEFANTYGHPTMILDDLITQRLSDRLRWSQHTDCLDVHLCFDIQLSAIAARYWDLVHSDPESWSGFSQHIDFGSLARAFDEEVKMLRELAFNTCPTGSEPQQVLLGYRSSLMALKIAYYRLVMYSFRLEDAYRSASEIRTICLTESFDIASEVLSIINEVVFEHEFYRYAPDIDWVQLVHAAVLLIKLARPSRARPPELSLTQTQQEEAFSLVRKFIFTLEMNAVDAEHSLATYA
ncbi:unnamed protein product, partial [Rhizoctonia solani]